MDRLLRTIALSMIMSAGLAWTPAGAVVINVTESTDLSNSSGTPTALGTLDIGTNIIIGGIDCASGCSAGDVHDYFNVILSAGQQITSITALLSNFDHAQGANGLVDVNGEAISPIAFNFVINNGNTPGTLTLFTGSAVGPGTQGFNFGISGGGSADRALSFDYEVHILVAAAPNDLPPGGAAQAIPEPAGLTLLGAGLMGVVLLRRRAGGF